MADDGLYAAAGGESNKRKCDDSQSPVARRATGFSSTPDLGAPPPSFNSAPPPMNEIELAKQKAPEIAARLLNNADPTKRARVENVGNGGRGFDSSDYGDPPQVQSLGGYPGPSKRIEIPNGRVGVIIGEGGETMKYLQVQSGAKIQVARDMDADPNSTTRVVDLMGTPDQIAKAEQLIQDVLSEIQFLGLRRAGIMANKEPLIISGKDEMRRWSRSARAEGKTIGLVPTMGYLHEGHLSLIQESKQHSDLTVVSVYVNPGQFSPNEDLSTYPSDFIGDINKLKGIAGGVDVVFHPKDLYDYGLTRKLKSSDGDEGKVVSCVENSGMGHETWVRVERLEKGLCGSSRPVFFRGVATIVTKLFNIVEPDVAVFGKKDYQQWRIIQRMVRDIDFGIKVIGADLVRDSDGLAKSSRNVRLSPQEREKALSISKSLYNAKTAAEKGQVVCRELKDSFTQAILEAGGKVDYAEIVDQESLVAVEEIKSPAVFCVAAWFGNVRLIDNMEINV